MDFRLQSSYAPMGDQPRAIEGLVRNIRAGEKHSVLVGVTGSGKTFTMANVIQQLQRPTLIISHNKTLAAQLYSEFKSFFPENAVEYFVSYFDYYQPEAYIPRTDTYIEKDSSINEEIERLRLSATSSLLTRRDTIVVASVSCIYGLGSPEDYKGMVMPLAVGQQAGRDAFLARLVEILYERNPVTLERGQFRVRGDVVELCPAYTEDALRIEFFGDEIDRITRFDILTGDTLESLREVTVFPAKHFITPADKMRRAINDIQTELEERIRLFEKEGRLLEAQRIKMRTAYDIDLMQEMGFCPGIENYSRHLSGRPPGARPYTLIDFFPEDTLLIIDESHATVPQIGGMYAGDRARKTVLVEHGFRLPSALDNRPLNFPEFEALMKQTVYVSATPGPYELKAAGGPTVEQVIRPTGLIDPLITVKPLKGQIDETIGLARERIARGERVLVTTLTKRTAEDLTDYLREAGLKVQYLHSEVDAIERVEILRNLRAGEFDILVGINLLREGLDLPEVSLVCILDADKEGYLRSETSLIQTAGRAARHINGHVVLFADILTRSIKRLLEVTEYRRTRQIAFNREHHITPQSVRRGIQESLQTVLKGRAVEEAVVRKGAGDQDAVAVLKELEDEMVGASSKLEFEKAALLRDQILDLKKTLGLPATVTSPGKPGAAVTYARGGRRKSKARG
ncbi:MAG: excinuclease ABC subunit UvrB [Candidatus Methylacidiphilales bacterium]|nr:excinuclease ABC subunit UvrB [Candidatus Methylacidiphilales bacterium]